MRTGKNWILAAFFTITFALLLVLMLSEFTHVQAKDQTGGDNNKETAAPVSSNEVSIELSEIAQKSIGLKIEVADIRSIEKILLINGIVKADPDRVGEASTRAEGRVENLFANIGDRVKKGQTLATILPRQIGNPPPVLITAPLSGIVVERNITLGSTVESNEALFLISDLSKVIVEGEVFGSDVSKVQLGQDARIRLDAYPDSVFNGKVTFVASRLDPIKRTLHLWVSLDNKEELLKPELFAEVTLVIEHSREVITVPVGAIIDDGAEKFVFVKNGKRFVRQDVAIGIRDDRYIEITDGLYPGDEVVTDGNRQIYTKWLFSR
ncbi:MAG: efflux RND transporter periplasmic adaptor subunit [Betaproteobacteria bacterium]|nr:MAG: efflux RND transporter periplasmic adaptor subunit [Betaproteobacteria bacterium]